MVPTTLLFSFFLMVTAVDRVCPLETLIRRQNKRPMVPPLPPDDPMFLPFPTPATGPYFDLQRTANVTAFKGVTTHLVCRVKRLENHTVSWIRMRDTTLLTVGRYTYTTDLRFEAFHSPHTDDWIIRLKNPKLKDRGFYGCQISTTPHQTREIYLDVLEPETHIIGGPDMYVDEGSMVNLTCVIANTVTPPKSVKWLHEGNEISFRGPRHGVSIITEKAKATRIHLLMQGANARDSGVFSCVPDNAPKADIKLHILRGNAVAGLQTNSSNQMWTPLTSSTVSSIVVSLLPMAALFKTVLILR